MEMKARERCNIFRLPFHWIISRSKQRFNTKNIMSHTKAIIPAVLLLLIFVTACDRPRCRNTNEIFDLYPPDAKEYKDELVRLLAGVDKSKLTYWMDTYQEESNAQSILVHIQGDGLCAKILLDVKNSQRGIEGILKNKGAGYQGAELEDLKFDIEQDSLSTEFIFREISGIID